jgi:hypothetical protein
MKAREVSAMYDNGGNATSPPTRPSSRKAPTVSAYTDRLAALPIEISR